MLNKLIEKIKKFFYPSKEELPVACQKVVIDAELKEQQKKAANDYVSNAIVVGGKRSNKKKKSVQEVKKVKNDLK